MVPEFQALKKQPEMGWPCISLSATDLPVDSVDNIDIVNEFGVPWRKASAMLTANEGLINRQWELSIRFHPKPFRLDWCLVARQPFKP
eukprot:scaffold248_cov111-Cylindrotheca_fusiformis.AAC.3